jgi:hypothetical protein
MVLPPLENSTALRSAVDPSSPWRNVHADDGSFPVDEGRMTRPRSNKNNPAERRAAWAATSDGALAMMGL